jgi:NAD(P)-dependent dehydrogenase (short-subunit alcohol dehydrogenase family)
MQSRSAVVTGAGTGLGFATAKMLKENGWVVYGTIIEGQSEEELRKLGITPYVLNIADWKETDAFADFVKGREGKNGLSALINVAGIAGPGGGVLEGVSPENAQVTFDVNLGGTLNMVRSFLPLLRQYGAARIVNVSAGTRTPAPFTGAYLVSKYGVEGITNVLRYEMAPFGIQATSIEPAGMKTPMTVDADARTKKTWEAMGPVVREAYYDKINPTLEFMNSVIDTAEEPEEVAKVILKALNAKKMKIRYMAKSVAWQAAVQRLLGEDAFESMMMKGMKLR